MTRFSIVIPCYNQGSFLHECLASLAAQTYAPAEIIVVDDGSTDPHTIRRIDELCTGGITLVRQANVGLPGARNAGIRRAAGDFIVPLDADDQLTPDALETYARAIAGDPTVDIWYPDFQHFGLRDDVWMTLDFNRWRILHSNVMGHSTAISRRVFDGGVTYNESMRKGFEDWEFYIHACCDREFTARAVKRPLFRYRQWGFSMLSASNQRADELRAQIRSARAIYSNEKLMTLFKRTECPFFAIACQSEGLAEALAEQEFEDWKVVNHTDTVMREGHLAVFQAQAGHALFVSCDDRALAGALDTDPYLLEKIAKTFETQPVALVCLVLAREQAYAYPGTLVPETVEPASMAARTIGFVVRHRHFHAHPHVARTDAGLLQDLVTHVEVTAPNSTRFCIVGAEGEPEQGLPLPVCRAAVAGAPSAPSSPLGFGKRLTEATRVLIGPQGYDRLFWHRRTMSKIRNLFEPPPELPTTHPAAPSFPIRQSSVSRFHDHRVQQGSWALATEPARFTVRRPINSPALVIAVPWIVRGGVDRAIIDFCEATSRIRGAPRRFVVTTTPQKMAWADRILPFIDGFFSLADVPAPRAEEAFCDLLTRLGARALLIANSKEAYDALPHLRRRELPIRVVAQLHNFDIDSTGKRWGYPDYAPSRYNNLIDAYATVSKSLAERVANEYYVSPTKLHTIHLGIDVSFFQEARCERFLPGRPARVLWLGRLSYQKDPLMLLQVAAAWRAKHGTGALRFVMVGGGELEPDVRAEWEREKLDDVVELAGATDSPLGLFRIADCLMLTSKYEGIPLVIYEAMAAGLPVITTTANSAIPEVLSSHEAMLIRNQQDPNEYVAALEHLLGNREDAQQRARRMAELAPRFHAERYAKQTLALLGLAPGGDL